MNEILPPGTNGDQLLGAPPASPVTHGHLGEPAEEVRRLDRHQFQRLVAQGYQLQGYDVLPTVFGAHRGIDLVLTRGDERILVRCSHWSWGTITVQEARAFTALVDVHEGSWGVWATSGPITDHAKDFAHHDRLTLLDAHAVAQLVAIGRIAETAGQPLPTESPVPCPTCNHHPVDTPSPTPFGPPAPVPALHLAPREAASFDSPIAWPADQEPTDPEPTETAAETPSALPTPEPITQPGRLRLGRDAPLTAGMGALAAVGLATLLLISQSIHLGQPTTPTDVDLGNPPAVALIGDRARAPQFGQRPMDVAIGNGVIYTANHDSGDVTVADASTLVPQRSITVTGSPIAIAVDPARPRVFLADARTARVLVVNTQTGKTTATLATKGHPSDLAYDPTRKRLFVVSADGNSLETFNTATMSRVGRVRVTGEPRSVTVDPVSHRVYVLTSTVGVYNGYTLTRLASVPLQVRRGASLAIDPQEGRLFLMSGSTVQEYTLATHQSRTFTLDATASAIAIEQGTRTAYLAYPSRNVVASISLG